MPELKEPTDEKKFEEVVDELPEEIIEGAASDAKGEANAQSKEALTEVAAVFIEEVAPDAEEKFIASTEEDISEKIVDPVEDKAEEAPADDKDIAKVPEKIIKELNTAAEVETVEEVAKRAIEDPGIKLFNL